MEKPRTISAGSRNKLLYSRPSLFETQIKLLCQGINESRASVMRNALDAEGSVVSATSRLLSREENSELLRRGSGIKTLLREFAKWVYSMLVAGTASLQLVNMGTS